MATLEDVNAVALALPETDELVTEAWLTRAPDRLATDWLAARAHQSP